METIKLTTVEKWRRRQSYIKNNLPIPEYLQPKRRGWTKGVSKGPRTPEPVQSKCRNKRERFKARQWYERQGLPMPEWLVPQKDMRKQWTVKNSAGISEAEYMQKDWPPWANWKAVDQSGDAWFFEKEPVQNDKSWAAYGRIQMLGEVVVSQWTKTKVEKRGS